MFYLLGLTMSGIYGFAAHNRVRNADVIIKKMRDALPSPGPSMNHEWIGKQGNIGLGALHPVRIGMTGHFAEDRPLGLCCALDGIIYRDSAGPGESLVESDGASLMLRRYLESGTDCFSQLSGSFNAALWDEKAGRLVVANDKLAQRLFFFGHRNGTLVFASYLARVIASDLLSREVDIRAFADLIRYQHVLGEKTLFKQILSLPPGSVLTYEKGHIDIKQYWQLHRVKPHLQYNERCLDKLEDLFKRAVKRCIRPDITTAIDLTGGLDSRCILAAAANMKLPFVTHTGGQSDSTDVVLARQASELVGSKHVFEPVGPKKMADWLIPMVAYQGGVISTLHSHPCQHFDMSLPFDAIVQGTCISYVRGLWVSPANLHIDSRSAAVRLLRCNMSSNTARHMDLRKLWKSEFHASVLSSSDEYFNSLFDQFNIPDRLSAVIDYIALRERCRKFLNKAIMIVRAVRDAYFPYLDHEFLIALAGIPISQRVTSNIQVDLIKRLCPKLLDIPYAKTLMPMSASPTKIRTVQTYRKLRRRISEKIGLPHKIPTTVPNHYLLKWTREEMRDSLSKLLYNPKAAFRAYLDWESIESLLNRHFSGKRNCEHLVGALTVFEIAHRLWVDPDPNMTISEKSVY